MSLGLNDTAYQTNNDDAFNDSAGGETPVGDHELKHKQSISFAGNYDKKIENSKQEAKEIDEVPKESYKGDKESLETKQNFEIWENVSKRENCEIVHKQQDLDEFERSSKIKKKRNPNLNED